MTYRTPYVLPDIVPATAGDVMSLVDGKWQAAAPNGLQIANIVAFGGDGGGTVDNTLAMAAAIAALAPGGSVYFPPGLYRFTTTQTWIANIWFAFGSAITVDSLATVTIDGLIDAHPRRQLFYGAGTVALGVVQEAEVCWFGADPTGVADSTSAIQKALDSFSTTTPEGIELGPCVELGRGKFRTSSPLRMAIDGISLVGEGDGVTLLFSEAVDRFAGPMVIMSATRDPFPTTTGILPTGVSGLMDPAAAAYAVDMRQGGTCELNGLAACTLELFVKIDPAFIGSSTMLFGSSGGLFAGTAADQAIRIQMAAVGSQWSLDSEVTTSVTGSITSGGSATLVDANTLYHLALVYDGAHAKLYINGTADANVITATGTIVQKLWEMMNLGFISSIFPLPGNQASWKGAIDSVRISKTARYTSNFTAPTDKLPFDSDTIMLVNFDEFDGRCLVAKSGITGFGGYWNTYLPCRYAASLVSGGTNQRLSGLRFEGMGSPFYMEGGVNSKVIGLSGIARDGSYFDSNSYYSQLKDYDVTYSEPNRCGLYYVQTGIHQCRDVQLSGGGFAIIADGSSISFENVTPSPNANAQASFFVRGSGAIYVLRDCFIDNEQVSTNWIAGLIVDDNTLPTLVIGGVLDVGIAQAGTPCILVSNHGNANSVICTGTMFGPSPSSTIFKFRQAPIAGAIYRADACIQSGPNAPMPWGDSFWTPTLALGGPSWPSDQQGIWGQPGNRIEGDHPDQLATTDATPTVAFSYAMPDNSGLHMSAKVIATNVATGDGATWILKGGYTRAGGAPVAMGTDPFTDSAPIGTNAGSPPSGWAAEISASGDNITVQVTGAAATNIRWNIKVETSEVA